METGVFIFLLTLDSGNMRRLLTFAMLFLSTGLLFAEEKTGELVVEGKKAVEEISEQTDINSDQIIQPKVKTTKVSIAKIDTEDFEVGVYGGIYSTQDFGSNSVVGIRFAYHVTESFFAEASFGATKTQRTSAEEQFNFDTMTNEERKLRYYNVLIAWNMLPGETYFGKGWAFPMALYIGAGMGVTEFAGEDRSTLVGGVGYRFLATDWMAFHLDFRYHVFDLVVLTEEKTTQNTEMHTGFTLFF